MKIHKYFTYENLDYTGWSVFDAGFQIRFSPFYFFVVQLFMHLTRWNIAHKVIAPAHIVAPPFNFDNSISNHI